ncbi:MAG: multicopper oxidase family protein [Vicinamibacterales bacterium]
MLSIVRASGAFVLLAGVAAYGDTGQVASAQAGPRPCAVDSDSGWPDADLYCIELLPAGNLESASGTARLLAPSSPFGVAVTAAGEHLYDVVFDVEGLPPPSTLGRYRTYVAWATTPQMHPLVKLGEIRNGSVRLGRIAFDRTLILVTAEASAGVSDRSGRLVLRGTSAAVRMQPHDLAFLLAGLLDRADAPADDHAHHATGGAPGQWSPPPMHPQVIMPPALMTLRPDVAPYAPAADDAIPLARPRELLTLRNKDSLALTAAPVRRILFGRTVTMLGFNGQYPGPLIQVDEGSTITVRFVNHTDFPTAVHWHGVRLDNRFDGAAHVTQDPVPPKGTFDYQVYFRDAGIYWYHPHHREDVLQDLGLYGNLLVRSRSPEFFAPANREEILMLDDLLVGDAGPIQHGLEAPTHALMGRFGNVLLVNGEPRWAASAQHGEVVRLFLTNVSSTRVFNLSFGSGGPGGAGRPGGAQPAAPKLAANAGVRMKIVASDLGRYEQESWVENVVIAPAERFVVDVRFEAPGEVRLVNRVRAIDHILARFFEETQTLGTVQVRSARATPDHAASFDRLRRNAEVVADINRYRPQFGRAVDHELSITLETSNLPFPLTPLMSFESVYRHPVEWSGTMPEMDWVATGRAARWILRERATSRENMDIQWRFRVGDVVKLRLVNDRRALHAMQHPIHIHGQRFLVMSVNGVPNDHLVWKDTVLVPTGFTTDVLLELSNPGKWMLHCHVAEHIETGMRMVFEVDR